MKSHRQNSWQGLLRGIATWVALVAMLAVVGNWIWQSEVTREESVQRVRIDGVLESQSILLSHFLDEMEASVGSLSSDLEHALSGNGAADTQAGFVLQRRHSFYPEWESVHWTPVGNSTTLWSRRNEEAVPQVSLAPSMFPTLPTRGQLSVFQPEPAQRGEQAEFIGLRMVCPVLVAGEMRGVVGIDRIYRLGGATRAALVLYDDAERAVWPVASAVPPGARSGDALTGGPLVVRRTSLASRREGAGDEVRSASRAGWQVEVSGSRFSPIGVAHLTDLPRWLFSVGGGVAILFGFLVYLRERAERAQRIANQSLERQGAYWSRVVNTLPIPIFFLDEEDGPFVRMNSAMERYVGHSTEVLRGKSLGELVPADSLEGTYAEAFTPREDGAEAAELTLQNGSGERRKATVVRASFADSEGGKAVVGAILDNTDAFHAYETMEAYLDLMTKVTSQVPGVVYQFKMLPDGSMSFPYASVGIRDLFEVMPLEVEQDASKVIMRVHPDDRPAFQASLIESRDTLTPWKSEYRVRRHDGTIRWLQGNSVPELESDGSVLWHGFISDVTEAKKIETQLRQAIVEAERADRAKGAFLAAMSHEIRTPMNGVIGMTSLLSKTSLDADQMGYVNTIRHSGDALLVVINDILDFSKIESGFLELDQTLFSVSDCVEGVVDILAPQAASKGLELACYIDPRVPAEMLGDMPRVRQVLVNLVGNAIKFTAVGEVFINLDLENTARGGFLRIGVEDTGPGIPEDRQERLFKPFSQVDTSTSRNYGGTGLGLAICRRLSDLMGAKLTFESKVGEGSTFVLTLPLDRISAGSSYQRFAPWQPALKGMRVLVAEPNPMLREVLLSQLADWSIEGTGVSAIEAFPEQWGDERFDACMLEKSFSSRLSSESRAALMASKLPVLELTSLGSTPSQEWKSHLVKPLKPLLLCQWLASVSPLSSLAPTTEEAIRPAVAPAAPPERQAETSGVAGRPLQILIAEDNLVNQKVATLFLRRMGYTADLVNNGEEAVAAVAAKRYDVVFMDVQMPLMDGLEATQAIRQLSGDAQQPWIVALTASAVQGDRERALSCGMNDYLPKPLKFEDLEGAIRKVSANAVEVR